MNTITGPRLVLRVLDQRDAAPIFRLNADPEVLKYVHDAPFANVQAAGAWIAGLPLALPLGIGRWAIETRSGTWIGRCSLRRQKDDEVLMGYRLLREHWGRGYASEAVRMLLGFAFDELRLPYVVSKVAKENLASQRVIQKNGGRFWKSGSLEDPHEALVYRFDGRPATAPEPAVVL